MPTKPCLHRVGNSGLPRKRPQTILRPGEDAAQHTANAHSGVWTYDDDATPGVCTTHAIPANANGTTDGNANGNADGDVATTGDEQ